jgi:RHS repeat-associated protein
VQAGAQSRVPQVRPSVGLTWDDGAGRRVQSSGGASGTRIYWYDQAGQVVMESMQGGSGFLNEYLYVGGQRVARVANLGPIYYYYGDHLGTARLITDGGGTKCYDADYFPWGGEQHVYVNSCAQNYKFTGKERDPDTGSDYFGARWYRNTMARFYSPDPINLTSARLVNPGNTLNKYVYAANNPLKYIDRDGEDITIFYRPPSGAEGDYGHILLGVLNQKSGQTGFLDYYPKSGADSLGRGAGAFNTGSMQERAEQNAAGKFATLTIQTSPEEAQKLLNQIANMTNGSVPDYSALTNNCTTICEDVLRDLGLDFGDVLPSSYWADVYYNFSADAQAHPIWTRMLGTGHTPGKEYGNPRNFGTGIPFSQWLFQLYMNQQQKSEPKACVEAHDTMGNSTGKT